MSTTPETDEVFKSIQNKPDAIIMSDLLLWSYRLEEARNAALASLAELHAALVRYEGEVDGEAPSEHRRMMDRAAALLPENA